jgi:hypothetical protein
MKRKLSRRLARCGKRNRAFAKEARGRQRRPLVLEALEDHRLLAVNLLDMSKWPVSQTPPVDTSDPSSQLEPTYASLVALTEGMRLIEPPASGSFNQLVYLDFDGASGVTFDGPVKMDNIDVRPFSAADAGLAGSERQIIADSVAQLDAWFMPIGVSFTEIKPASGDFSTIYVGGDGREFHEYGSFLGLAEKVDVGNRDPHDQAFVFSNLNRGKRHFRRLPADRERRTRLIERTTGVRDNYFGNLSRIRQRREVLVASLLVDELRLTEPCARGSTERRCPRK